MSKKRFKDWMQTEVNEEWDEREEKFSSRKDYKRYDKKKAKIQSARRNKRKNKFSHLE